jgi:hypothetical protein
MIFTISKVSSMGSEDCNYNFLPGMLVYVKDVTKIWEDGIVTSVSKNKCTVAVTNKKVYTYHKIHIFLG